MKNSLFFILIFIYSCKSNELEHIENEIAILAKNDVSLPAPAPGDWLYAHPEKGQSFEAYWKCKPISPTASKKVIYLQPIGNFDGKSDNLIKATAEYLNAFYGLKTKILHRLPNTIFSDSVKRIWYSEDYQILAPYILNQVLKKIKPADAIGIMAITEKDIYPNMSFNFVFGLSSFRDMVSVTSMARLSDGEVDSVNRSLCLNRLLKISTHEIGHMFTVHHCTHAKCLMNGSNGLFETDDTPNKLCSVCTGKVIWNLQLNSIERTARLTKFFKKYKLLKEYELLKKDDMLLQATQH